MSAFAVLYTSIPPPNPEMFERVMQLMSHRGPDGSDRVIGNGVILGHWHFWTTPEEKGERQPLMQTGLPFKIVFDGRIDNREEIFDKLSIAPHERDNISDASLSLIAYEYWHEGCFKHFVGEFALVILDEEQDKLICARDPLGERTLFYTVYGPQIVIASEAWAVANASRPVVNERSAVRYLAVREFGINETMFEGVYEIPQAHIMTVSRTDRSFTRYWQPDFNKKIRYKDDTEYSEHFLDVLSQSVYSRLRSITPLGALMSGGMDSPSVVAIAAQELAPQRLTTFTHVFDGEALQICDERKYVNEMARCFNLYSIQIPCDDAWVLKEWNKLPVNPNHPDINAYRWVKEREYERVHAEGIRVLLTGGFGDTLYEAGIDWFVDLLIEGRIPQAIQEVLWLLSYAGWQRNWRAGYLQSTIKYFLKTLPFMNRLFQKFSSPAWIGQQALFHLPESTPTVHRKLERHGVMLGAWVAGHESVESYFASRHQVELRHPYRDRRLVEFMLALPAYQLHWHGLYKYILRIAMKDSLPESIRTRRDITSLTPFFSLGMKKEEESIRQCLQNENAVWRPFIDNKWVNNFHVAVEKNPTIIPWLLTSYEQWARTTFAN